MQQQGLGYRPGLDGLRGLSILGVLLFHAELPVARGGFLGVSIFYTLSGFLITSLLLDSGRGRIDLAGFWLRRVRRLLPAALLGLALAAGVGFAVGDGELRGRLSGDLFWSLGYALNWRLIREDYSYTLLFSDPSPVQHFWSLAIEAQLYLVVPLLFAWVWRGRAPRIAAATAFAAAAASGGLAAILYTSGSSLDRIYYGTDTRAAELLVGCGLALWRSGTPNASLRVPEWLAVATLVATCVAFAIVPVTAPWLHAGGLLLFAGLSVVLVLTGLEGRGPTGRLLSARPLVALGRISYGVYVYHWPIFLLLAPGRVGVDPWAANALRVGASLAIAWASERWVERPIRRNAQLGWTQVTAGGLAGIAGVATAAIALAPAILQPEEPELSESTTLGGLGVAFFGDSTMMTLQMGIGPWLRSQGARVEPSVTLKGCGLFERGGTRTEEGTLPEAPVCLSRTRRWRDALAQGEADAAVVMLGPWDVVPRQLAKGRDYEQPGDTVFDELLEDEIERTLDLFEENGVRVVWLTTPRFSHTEKRPRNFQRYNEGVDQANRIARRVAARHPQLVEIIDLAAHMDAGPGRIEDRGLRADGVHWTVAGARALARDWLGPQVEAALTRHDR